MKDTILLKEEKQILKTLIELDKKDKIGELRSFYQKYGRSNCWFYISRLRSYNLVETGNSNYFEGAGVNAVKLTDYGKNYFKITFARFKYFFFRSIFLPAAVSFSVTILTLLIQKLVSKLL